MRLQIRGTLFVVADFTAAVVDKAILDLIEQREGEDMTFKAGVIGKGFIGPAHAEALMRLGGVEVVALAGTDDAATREKAVALGIRKGYGDWRKLVHDDEVEVIHVCSPNNLHFEMAKEALEAGKHVVCEKPLTVSVEEAQELVELAEKKKLVNTVHFNIRYYPLMQHLHELVAAGELGRIFAVHGSYLQDWLFYPTDYSWRLEGSRAGKSRAVADIGSHWLDLVEFVSGVRVEAVLADFQTVHPVRKKPLKPLETYAGKMLAPEDYEEVSIDTEDYASVLLRFEGGARGVMTVSQVAAGRKNRLSFELDGSKRSAAWDSEAPNRLWIGRRDGNNEVVMKDPSLLAPAAQRTADYPGGHNEGFPDTFKQMFKDVYAYLANGDLDAVPPFPTFKDGLREIVLEERIVESSKTGSWTAVK